MGEGFGSGRTHGTKHGKYILFASMVVASTIQIVGGREGTARANGVADEIINLGQASGMRYISQNIAGLEYIRRKYAGVSAGSDSSSLAYQSQFRAPEERSITSQGSAPDDSILVDRGFYSQGYEGRRYSDVELFNMCAGFPDLFGISSDRQQEVIRGRSKDFYMKLFRYIKTSFDDFTQKDIVNLINLYIRDDKGQLLYGFEEFEKLLKKEFKGMIEPFKLPEPKGESKTPWKAEMY